jgi:hypothetical protein
VEAVRERYAGGLDHDGAAERDYVPVHLAGPESALTDRNMILVTPTRGELWMGGYPHGDHYEYIYCVVSMTDEWFELLPVELQIHIPLMDRDDELVKDPEKADKIRAAAKSVAKMVREGKHVIVHCGAGLNRSGVMVGRILMELGYSSDAAIEIIRRKRSRDALFNRGFELWLLEEDGHALPTKETTAIK